MGDRVVGWDVGLLVFEDFPMPLILFPDFVPGGPGVLADVVGLPVLADFATIFALLADFDTTPVGADVVGLDMMGAVGLPVALFNDFDVSIHLFSKDFALLLELSIVSRVGLLVVPLPDLPLSPPLDFPDLSPPSDLAPLLPPLLPDLELPSQIVGAGLPVGIVELLGAELGSDEGISLGTSDGSP